jgi:hypothetical protein
MGSILVTPTKINYLIKFEQPLNQPLKLSFLNSVVNYHNYATVKDYRGCYIED